MFLNTLLLVSSSHTNEASKVGESQGKHHSPHQDPEIQWREWKYHVSTTNTDWTVSWMESPVVSVVYPSFWFTIAGFETKKQQLNIWISFHVERKDPKSWFWPDIWTLHWNSLVSTLLFTIDIITEQHIKKKKSFWYLMQSYAPVGLILLQGWGRECVNRYNGKEAYSGS